MGRDLLYKPGVPQPLGDDDRSSSKSTTRTGPQTPRGREVGRVGDVVPKPLGKDESKTESKRPAFKAAYFNEDTSGVGKVNLRASRARSLRGGEGATDLRKVVLPAAIGVESPEPQRLKGAADLMGIDGSFEPSLESFLGRHGAWAKSDGMTVERLKERMRMLEQMVVARQAALQRLRKAKGYERFRPVTVERAVEAGGAALDQMDDVVQAGRELVQRTANQASGMHQRIAKMLGIKVV